MSLFRPAQRDALRQLAELPYSNPFLPERQEREAALLGGEYVERAPFWSFVADPTAAPHPKDHPNLGALEDKARELLDAARDALRRGAKPADDEAVCYEEALTYLLCSRHLDSLQEPSLAGHRATG